MELLNLLCDESDSCFVFPLGYSSFHIYPLRCLELDACFCFSKVRLGVCCILYCAPIVVIIVFHSSAPSTFSLQPTLFHVAYYILCHTLFTYTSASCLHSSGPKLNQLKLVKAKWVFLFLLFVEKLPSLLPVKRVFPKKSCTCVLPL